MPAAHTAAVLGDECLCFCFGHVRPSWYAPTLGSARGKVWPFSDVIDPGSGVDNTESGKDRQLFFASSANTVIASGSEAISRVCRYGISGEIASPRSQ